MERKLIFTRSWKPPAGGAIEVCGSTAVFFNSCSIVLFGQHQVKDWQQRQTDINFFKRVNKTMKLICSFTSHLKPSITNCLSLSELPINKCRFSITSTAGGDTVVYFRIRGTTNSSSITNIQLQIPRAFHKQFLIFQKLLFCFMYQAHSS